jgi:hypothetical protein
MSILKPEIDSRIGVAFNNEAYSVSSIITAVEVDEDSPFWSIHFGKKVNNGEGPPMDDRGVVVLEESMIRDIIAQINAKNRGEDEWVEYR